MKKLRNVCLMLFVALIYGCASGNLVSESYVKAKFKKGMPKAQLITAFGQPESIEISDEDNSESWRYATYSFEGQSNKAFTGYVISVDKNGADYWYPIYSATQ